MQILINLIFIAGVSTSMSCSSEAVESNRTTETNLKASINLKQESSVNTDIEGEYYCGDEASSTQLKIKKSSGDKFSFYINFHSEKYADYGGHLFEHEDVFERVYQ